MFIQRGAASDVKPTGGRPRSNLPDRSQIKKPRPAFPKLRERQERGVIDSGSSGGRGRRFRLHAAGCHEGQRYRGEHLHAELDCHAERSDAVRRFQHDKASGAEPTEITGGAEVAEKYVGYLFDDVHLNFGDLAQARQVAEGYLASLGATDRAAIFTTSASSHSKAPLPPPRATRWPTSSLAR